MQGGNTCRAVQGAGLCKPEARQAPCIYSVSIAGSDPDAVFACWQTWQVLGKGEKLRSSGEILLRDEGEGAPYVMPSCEADLQCGQHLTHCCHERHCIGNKLTCW